MFIIASKECTCNREWAGRFVRLVASLSYKERLIGFYFCALKIIRMKYKLIATYKIPRGLYPLAGKSETKALD